MSANPIRLTSSDRQSTPVQIFGDIVMPPYCIDCTNPSIAVEKILDHAELHRKAGCFNFAWHIKSAIGQPGELYYDSKEIQFAGPGSKFCLLVRGTVIATGRSSFVLNNGQEQNYSKPLHTDSRALHDVWMTMHHRHAGPCLLERDGGTPMLDRIEKIEARLEDLVTAVTDDYSRPEPAPKRLKLPGEED